MSDEPSGLCGACEGAGCEKCGFTGSGHVHQDPKPCEWCDGEGCEECTKKVCPRCQGTGCEKCQKKVKKKACDWCDGEGCEECGGPKKPPVCEWCDGLGCEECGGAKKPTTSEREEKEVKKKCDYCEDAGCYKCKVDPHGKIISAFTEAEAKSSTDVALTNFKKVVELSKGQKGLKAEHHTCVLKSLQSIVSLLNQLNREKEAISAYKDLLAYLPNVSATEGETAITSSLIGITKLNTREHLYELAVSALSKTAGNEKIIFSLQIGKGQFFVSRTNYKEAQAFIDTVRAQFRGADGKDDTKAKAFELIEIYALEFKIAEKTKDSKRNRELYELSKDLCARAKSPNPKAEATIRECWGKMFGDEGDWSKAYLHFWSAFNSYLSFSDQKMAKNALKYAVMSNMLSKSDVNIFSYQEARSYVDDPDFRPYLNFRAAYNKGDAKEFDRTLDEVYTAGDDFIKSHVRKTLDEFQRLVVLKIIGPSSRVKISDLATKLIVNNERAEAVVSELIASGRVDGNLDRSAGVLNLSAKKRTE